MSKYLLLIIFISQYCFSETLELCTNEEINQFGVVLKNEVLGKIEYPKTAKMRGWEGEGRINFLIIDGVVFSKEIKQSTGYRLLDFAMEDAINNSIFPKLTCQTMSKDITVSIPIAFTLLPNSPTHHTSGTPNGTP